MVTDLDQTDQSVTMIGLKSVLEGGGVLKRNFYFGGVGGGGGGGGGGGRDVCTGPGTKEKELFLLQYPVFVPNIWKESGQKKKLLSKEHEC